MLSLYGSFQASEGEWKGVSSYSRGTRTMGLLELGCWISLIKISRKTTLILSTVESFRPIDKMIQTVFHVSRCNEFV